MPKEKKRKKNVSEEKKEACSEGNIAERLKRPGVFGYMWPMITTLIGLFFLIVMIWVIRIVNNELNSNFLTLVMAFLVDNIALILIASLLLGYGEYLYRFSGTKAIGPLFSALGAALFLMFIANILKVIDSELLGEKISEILAYVESNILLFFVLFLVVGYIKFFVDVDRILRNVK